MNITITPEQEAIFATEAAERNKTLAEGQAPHTAESVALLLIAASAESYATTHEAALRAALAQNEDLMRVGKAVSLAPPNKQAAAIAAAEAALLSVHIPKQ
jgi:hypothetical protein